jgi:hypothetical protein
VASADCLWNLKLVHDDTVVVDFSEVVSLSQIVPRYFVVFRDVITFAESADPEVNVFNPGVAVDEDNVVVDQVHVEKHDCELYQKCNEQPHHPTGLGLGIIVVKFPQVSALIHPGSVNDANENKVHDCKQPVPRHYFAEVNGEAENVLVAQMLNRHKKQE